MRYIRQILKIAVNSGKRSHCDAGFFASGLIVLRFKNNFARRQQP